MTRWTGIRQTIVTDFARTIMVVATTALLMVAAQIAPAQALTNYSSKFAALQITAHTSSSGVFDPAMDAEH